MEQVEVSVCIITYMHEKYIRQCLDSVFMQKTNFNFEVIVSEDASPDNTREILFEYKEKYGDKLILNLQEKNVGGSKNSLSGRKLARGKYTAVVEGDDYWTDEYKLQKQYDILEKYPNFSAVASDFMSVSEHSDVLQKSVLHMKKDEIKTIKNSLRDGYTIHTCTLFYRNIFPENDEKYINLRLCAPTMGDAIALTLLYDAGDIYVLKDVMSAHRSAGKNDTSSFSFNQKTKAIEYTYMFIKIHEELGKYLNYKYDFSPSIANRIATVKKGRLLKHITYSSAEMNKLMKTLPVKTRIMVYTRLIKKLYVSAVNKLRYHNGK